MPGWAAPAERERLSALCWRMPDPNSYMDMPNAYRAVEDRWREKRRERPATEP